MGALQESRMRLQDMVFSVLCAVCCLASALRASGEVLEKTNVDWSSTKTAVFALGSFWRGEAVFGCLPGVLKTRVGYCGGSRSNPDYHNVGDHVEAVEVQYDPSVLRYEQLLDVFWANHDPTQTFGQGPDVGLQYRSTIFTQRQDELKLAAVSRNREQLKFRGKVLVTQIRALGVFYPAEMEHQKFELRRKPWLLQIIGDLRNGELLNSMIAAKLNGYAANMCPTSVRKLIDMKVRPFLQHRPNLLKLFGD